MFVFVCEQVRRSTWKLQSRRRNLGDTVKTPLFSVSPALLPSDVSAPVWGSVGELTRLCLWGGNLLLSVFGLVDPSEAGLICGLALRQSQSHFLRLQSPDKEIQTSSCWFSNSGICPTTHLSPPPVSRSWSPALVYGAPPGFACLLSVAATEQHLVVVTPYLYIHHISFQSNKTHFNDAVPEHIGHLPNNMCYDLRTEPKCRQAKRRLKGLIKYKVATENTLGEEQQTTAKNRSQGGKP